MKKFSSTTKTNSYRSLQIKRIKIIVLLGMASAFCWFLLPILLRTLAAFIVLPFIYFSSWWQTSENVVPSFFRDRTELIAEIDRLQSELEVAQFMADADLNQLSQSQDANSPTNVRASTGIVGSVVARPPFTPYDVLVIDVGADDGVEQGAPVFVGGHIIIGTIQKVYKNSAVVVLLSTPKVPSTVFIIGPDIFAEAKGVGGGTIEIGVPQGVVLAVGDPVVFPILQDNAIGRISSIASVASEPEQKAYVSIPVSLQSIRRVEIGLAPVTLPKPDELKDVVDSAKEKLRELTLPLDQLYIPSSTSAASTSTAEQGSDDSVVEENTSGE